MYVNNAQYIRFSCSADPCSPSLTRLFAPTSLHAACNLTSPYLCTHPTARSMQPYFISPYLCTQVRLSGLREELQATEAVVMELRAMVAHAEQQCCRLEGGPHRDAGLL